MVLLDHGLIGHARRLNTGVNVHRAKELIFAYEQAVLLHNEGSPGHVIYQKQFEDELRQFTIQETARRADFAIRRRQDTNDLDERSRAAIERARDAMAKMQSLNARCEHLDDLINTALSLGDDPTSTHLLAVARRDRQKNVRRRDNAA